MALLCHNLAMLLCLWAGKQSLYPFHILEFPRPGDIQNTNALCLLDLPVTAQWGPGCGHRVSPNGQSHTGYPAGPSLGLCSADLFYPRKLLLCVGMRPQCCLQFSRAACYPGLNPPCLSAFLVHVISQVCPHFVQALGRHIWCGRAPA